ncbi:MAG: hypothetical protein FJX72_18380, partial [Armatimonadetes bacterium]|nr:hypothetical protein [Armatimonadota bacterium]
MRDPSWNRVNKDTHARPAKPAVGAVVGGRTQAACTGYSGGETVMNGRVRPAWGACFLGAMLLATRAIRCDAQPGPGWPVGWGSTECGQVGDGPGPVSQPVESLLSDAVSVAAGDHHSLALKSDGTVWACGLNRYGQLGDGTTTDRAAPVAVSGLSGVVAVAAGEGHSLVLKSDGTVWAWGYNGYGQLGDGTTTHRTAPVAVSGLSGLVSVAAGYGHSLAVKSDGAVWAWGY